MEVITGFFVVYFLLLVFFLAGWARATQRRRSNDARRDQMISVVIPARNEELVIPGLLEDLKKQDYRKFEVIVVNDDSDDETLWVVSRSPMKNLHVLHNKGKGKKAAITTGVRQARGTIIVTTDADCSVPPGWLEKINDTFRDPAVAMAFGGVRMRETGSFFEVLQALEFSSLIGSGAATAALGVPTMCNGANMAFRRKVFSEVNGYEGNLDIPSGDDEFLMRKISRRYRRGIRFMGDPETVVTTVPQPDIDSFFNQRVRWASKWRYNPAVVPKMLAVVVIFFQINVIAAWILVFSPWIAQALFLIVIKMILEAALLLQVCRFLRSRWNWLAFFALQILYPVYVIAVGAGSFFVPFRWKNRIFKTQRVFRLRRR